MKTLLITSAVTGLISVSSCACWPSTDDDYRRKMETLGKQLTGLTEAVEAAVREDPAGTAGLSDEALLERSTADRPDLRESFKGYKVTTTRVDKLVFVLVCTLDGTHALLEDAGCTGKLDRKPWQESPSAACQSTLQAAAVCKR